jgi:hypothetical protein
VRSNKWNEGRNFGLRTLGPNHRAVSYDPHCKRSRGVVGAASDESAHQLPCCCSLPQPCPQPGGDSRQGRGSCSTENMIRSQPMLLRMVNPKSPSFDDSRHYPVPCANSTNILELNGDHCWRNAFEVSSLGPGVSVVAKPKTSNNSAIRPATSRSRDS